MATTQPKRARREESEESEEEEDEDEHIEMEASPVEEAIEYLQEADRTVSLAAKLAPEQTPALRDVVKKIREIVWALEEKAIPAKK